MPAAAGVAAYSLPQAIPHPAIGIISTIATYLLRLTAVGGIVTHLVTTTTPTEFTAALRAARIPARSRSLVPSCFGSYPRSPPKHAPSATRCACAESVGHR